MTMMRSTGITLIISLVLCTFLSGQKQVDIMLKAAGQEADIRCFDIMLRSPGGHDIDLAGQNYRIFYNADQVSFIPDRISRSMDNKTYSQIDLINTEDQNIGFISMSIDGKALTEDVITLNRDASWKQTMNICFALKSDQGYNITWANAKKTSLFATAEVAMSEWLNAEKQQVLLPNETFDFSSLDYLEESRDGAAIRVYPNPVTDFVQIDFDGAQINSSVIIQDVIGREVINEQVQGLASVTYSLDKWPEGAYTVTVLDNDGHLISSENIVKITP